MSAPTKPTTPTAMARARKRRTTAAAAGAPAPAVPAPVEAGPRPTSKVRAALAAFAAPAPAGKAGRARKRRVTRAAAVGAPVLADTKREPNPRWRWLAFNASAAGAGHLAVWSLTGDPWAGVGLMARMTVSVPQLAAAGLTLVAAYGGWRAGALLKGLPGLVGLAARPVGALLAALWGQETAPLVRDGLDAIEPWGTLLSPLLAVGPLAAACWYGLDRRAAAARLVPPVRWALRIPLATVALSALLYTPGVLL
ncbi:hypothetical protein ACIPJG_33370 [Streptomyces halstedii]|uniref:hypothetical protein n=1 Tax=Streptomyces halstedii TaxID=1944 RepID=UPI0038008D4B